MQEINADLKNLVLCTFIYHLICGNLNINVCCLTVSLNFPSEYLHLLASFGLIQLVCEPTNHLGKHFIFLFLIDFHIFGFKIPDTVTSFCQYCY